MKKKVEKQSKKSNNVVSLDEQFFEKLENCLNEEKQIRKSHKVCVNKGIELCVNVKNGVVITKSNKDKKGKSFVHKYNKHTRKAATAFLKKFAVKHKVK